MKRVFTTTILTAVVAVLALVGAGNASANEPGPKLDGCVALNLKADIALKVAENKLAVATAAAAKAQADLVAALAAVPNVPATVAAAQAAVASAAVNVTAAAKVVADAKLKAAIDHCKNPPTTTTATVTATATATRVLPPRQVVIPATPRGVGTGDGSTA